MKKLFFLILLIVYIGIHAGIIEKSFSFDEKHLKIQKENGYDYITFKECFNPRNLGLPFVPCKTVKFVIPPSAVITNIKVISSSSSILSGTYNIYPAQKPVPVSFNVENEFILPEKTIYESDNLYPGKLIELLPIGNKAGFRIAQINLFPIQYQPKQKKLIFNSSITIRIEFQEGVCQVKRLSDKQIQIFGKEIKMIVDNPEDVEHYAPRVSSYGLLITPYPIEGVEIKGETKTVPIPRIESEIRILESKTMKILQHEERINKLKREKIKNTISDFVICKPWIEAVHPILKRIVRSKGIVVNSYISSPHPYFNSMNNYYYIYGPPENNRMCVHFDTLNIESGYDTIYVYDNNGILINTYSGVYGPTWSSWGDGPTFTIKIKTDVSVTRYGFDVDYIQVGGSCSYENSLHPYANNTNESIDMYGPLNDWIGRVCFHYDSIHAESGYDYVYCYDIDNTTILNTWSGQYDNVWSNWSTYNSSYITQIHERTNLESDGSVTEYGWLVNYFNFNRGHQVESAHNYPNNANQTYYVYGPQDEGSIQMRLHFSKLYTESGYDTVYVYDGKDNLMNIYTGDLGTDFWTSWGDSNFVKIVLKSDNSVTRWGFKCDQYEWQAAGQPNLTYYQPTGWSSPLVCAINRDTDTTAITSDTLIAGDSSFVSWAMINSGTADATDTIYWYLYIDDSYLAGWYSVGLQQGYYTYVRGYGFIESIAGSHALSDSADATHRITESNETDNGYALTYYWKSESPNLTYYTPTGWDYPIVPSSVSGTNTVGPNLKGDSTTYVDWAIVNNGSITAKPKFYTYIYSDGVPLAGWFTDSLKAGYYTYIEDWTHIFTAGDHTLMTFVDSTYTVAESNEIDNKYSRLFTWSSGGGGGGVYKGNAEYIIITDPAFVDAFKPLRDWKSKKGVPASIITTDSIYINYTGIDNADKMRNFIKEAKDSNAIYILLGGQCDYEHTEDYVPRRNTYCLNSGVGYYTDEDTIPCDLYYSDLDGSWDGDGDGIYGETSDAVDMYADIYIGRAPVKNITQVQNFVSKVLAYEKNPNLNYVKKIYLPQGNLWVGNTGQGINDAIADTIPDSWQKSKQYENIEGISQAVVNDSMNSAFNLQHWVGHGNEVGIYYNGGSTVYYSSGDPPNNTNDSTRTSIINSIACFTGALDEVGSAYDYDCLAERMVNNNKCASVATMMNTRYGWGYSSPEGALGPSGELSVWFYRKLFGTNAQHLGQVFSASKDQLVPTALSDTYFRWVLYELTLFGDPEMPIWTDHPISLFANHSDTLGFTGKTDTFKVYVYDGTKAAISGALVTVMQDSTIYERDITDAAGWATIIINPSNTGIASITVTAYETNHLVYEGASQIYESPTAINFSSFSTLSGEGEIIIKWKAENEYNVLFWTIARSTEKQGEYARISDVNGKNLVNCGYYTYRDKDVKPGKIYWYKLGQVNSTGRIIWNAPISGIAGIGILPKTFALRSAYPNPFTDATIIQYEIPQKSYVSLTVYNISGQFIKTLVNEEKTANYYSVKWDGKDDSGKKVSGGIYFYKLRTNTYNKTKKLIFIN